MSNINFQISPRMDVIGIFLLNNPHRHRLPLPVALQVFKNIKNEHDRVDFAYDYFSYLNPPTDMLCSPKKEKSDVEAVKLREEGNQIFRLKNSLDALQLYTQSIGYAKIDSSHLGLAYGNRSAVLFEKGYYKECLEDIARAFENNFPVHLHGKLLRRQKLAEDLQTKHSKSFLYHEKVPEILNKHPRIMAAADCVELERNEMYGMHIVTTRDVQAGELISVEKPFVHNLYSDHKYRHCHQCLEMCYNMIPCENCATALYCGLACRSMAFESYHRYECNFGSVADNEVDYLKATLVGAVEHKNFNKVDDDDMYRSDRYKEVYKLESNESKLDIQDHFEMAILAGSVFHHLKRDTNFLQENDLNENLVKGMMLRNILIECVNSLGVIKVHFYQEPLLGTYYNVVGHSIYSFTSRYNHSCVENCAGSFYGATCVITAIKDIKKGEQCTITYGCNYRQHSRQYRQKLLQKRYLFDCKCTACKNYFPLAPMYLPESAFDLMVRQRPDLIVPAMKVAIMMKGILNPWEKLPEDDRNDLLKTCFHLQRCFTEPSDVFTFIQSIILHLLSLSENTEPF